MNPDACSAWEGEGDQMGGRDKESFKDRPPATQGGEDYMANRLDQTVPEIEKMFGEDR